MRPLREAHAHIAAHGRELTTLQLGGCASREACLELLAQEASRLDRADPSRSRWLLANGVRAQAWQDPRWPTRGELDALVGSRPASVMSFDYHALLASSAAFRAAGIADDAPNPAGGIIERDARTHAPTGLLLESACWMVRSAVPEPGPDERVELVHAALLDLARHGFVEVHDLLSQPWLGPTLATLHAQGRLPCAVLVYPLLAELAGARATARSWEVPGRVRLAGAKLFADGTLNSKTAWMLSPFRTGMKDHPCGTPLLSVDELAAGLATCVGAGLQLAVHAIGDGAVRAVLDAAQRVLPGAQRCPDAEHIAGARWLRIEHCELIDEADVPRFARLGVVCSVQPCHLLYDIEVLERELPHRLERVLPLRELVAAGLEPGKTLLFGSDTPIVRPHPQDSIDAAVHRARVAGSPGGKPTGPIAPGQAVDIEQAWRCFAPGMLGGPGAGPATNGSRDD